MPPPPSPASSTCSETGSVAGGSQKKHKRPAPRGDSEDKRGDEEEWVLKDVIFIEDVKNVPIGRVLKVDGAYAAVRFPSNKDYSGKEAKDLVVSANSGSEDPASLLQDCRLLRKDELQVSGMLVNLSIASNFVNFCVLFCLVGCKIGLINPDS
jgi:E3 ubiquitin-protein ligase EDD1